MSYYPNNTNPNSSSNSSWYIAANPPPSSWSQPMMPQQQIQQQRAQATWNGGAGTAATGANAIPMVGVGQSSRFGYDSSMSMNSSPSSTAAFHGAVARAILQPTSMMGASGLSSAVPYNGPTMPTMVSERWRSIDPTTLGVDAHRPPYQLGEESRPPPSYRNAMDYPPPPTRAPYNGPTQQATQYSSTGSSWQQGNQPAHGDMCGPSNALSNYAMAAAIMSVPPPSATDRRSAAMGLDGVQYRGGREPVERRQERSPTPPSPDFVPLSPGGEIYSDDDEDEADVDDRGRYDAGERRSDGGSRSLKRPGPAGYDRYDRDLEMKRARPSDSPSHATGSPYRQTTSRPEQRGRMPQIDLIIHEASIRCRVIWRLLDQDLLQAVKNGQHGKDVKLKLMIRNQYGTSETITLALHERVHEFDATAGFSYSLQSTLVRRDGRVLASGEADCKALYSVSELDELYDMAVKYYGNSMHSFTVLYRCKPRAYWDEIRTRHNNLMRKYVKDNNGHDASPINGRIYGLFFNAKNSIGRIPDTSPFGDQRITIPAGDVLEPALVNFYFADFYCNYKMHYVTVVVTLDKSETDAYCQRRLKKLDIHDNPFLSIVPNPERSFDRPYLFYINACQIAWVEIYWTEDVVVNFNELVDIQAVGPGSSRSGGLQHNKECKICNLLPMDDVIEEVTESLKKAQKEQERSANSTRIEEIDLRYDTGPSYSSQRQTSKRDESQSLSTQKAEKNMMRPNDEYDDDLQVVSSKRSFSQPLPKPGKRTPKQSVPSATAKDYHIGDGPPLKAEDGRSRRPEPSASGSVDEYFKFRRLFSDTILDRLHADTLQLAGQLFPTVRLPSETKESCSSVPPTVTDGNGAVAAASASPDQLSRLLDEFDCSGNLLIANMLSKLRCVLNKAR